MKEEDENEGGEITEFLKQDGAFKVCGFEWDAVIEDGSFE